MMEKLDLLVRFWELREKEEIVHLPLEDGERAELLSLFRLVATDKACDPGPAPCVYGSLPVQMTARSGFLAGDLREITADQLVIAAADMLIENDQTIVYIADALTGVEYTLPCIVLWAHADTPCAMGLAIDGIPVRATFTIPVAGMLRSPLGVPALPRAMA